MCDICVTRVTNEGQRVTSQHWRSGRGGTREQPFTLIFSSGLDDAYGWQLYPFAYAQLDILRAFDTLPQEE